MKVYLCVVFFICIVFINDCQGYTQQNALTNHTLPSTEKSQRKGRIFFNSLFGGLFGGDSDSDDGYDDDIYENNKEKTRNCSCECGISNHENRIVGGRPTGINHYPWIARIVYDGRYHCGASLLTENYVLTAAHCVRKLKRSKIRVILGDHDQSTTTDVPAKMRAVSEIIRHRNFDTDTFNHDIALLKLRKKIEFNKTIRPICLPSGGDPAGKSGIVIGWGRTSEGGPLPSVLQEVEVPILTTSQCKAMKYRGSRITSYMLCAGKESKDSCQGDSGGPLLVETAGKYEIVGIVSWGVGCAKPGFPGVYTRVSRYVNWLRLNLDDCLCV